MKLSEKEVEDFCWEFELLLLESDVEISVAKDLAEELKTSLSEAEIGRSTDYTTFISGEIKTILENNLAQEDIDLLDRSNGKKPFVVMFLGPNGAGKTTTIAKISDLLLKNNKQVILAAADTFRAGSIQQLEAHAERLKLKTIKHDYGADPAAVAFDAVASAKAKGLDFVLIDTAGRQQTNINLMDELKKIVRVVEPDLKIFVGEAIAGQGLVEQIEHFHSEFGVDGVILTKIDADVKGGGAISILSKLKIPILYVGTGQEYSDLLKFTPSVIIDRIL
ncbi:MAG: signal recognition particle-docking protein FtsY [Candidatus Diapherotrites archaeon]|nr:signal recognition particle-docking protein FtsY [Candidatus Diapherotrites archaeon]